ncbi:MAG: zinc ABC transporter substrate-binding protein, partial [Alloalcanivorax xenomutans]
MLGKAIRLVLVVGIGAALIMLSAMTPAIAGDKFKVVTTFTVIADIARNVAGEAATVESIVKPGAEIHNYQPTPGDIKRAQGAHLILWNGLNLESWFERFFRPDMVSGGVLKNLTDQRLRGKAV